MNDDDGAVPDWIGILDRPKLDPKLTDAQLVDQYCILLKALIERYDFVPPADGCPNIVIEMALQHIPAFQINGKIKLPVSGAPIKSSRWAVRAHAIGEMRKLQRSAAKTGSTVTGLAAKAAARTHRLRSAIELRARLKYRDDPKMLNRIMKTPSIKTIQHLMSAKIPFPAEWEADSATDRARRMLWLAAERLRVEQRGP